MSKLNVKALGLAFGIVWGAGVFLLGIFTMLSGWGIKWVELIASCYIGYQPTFLGSIIGGIWGFVDAGIGGILVAWLYNKFSR